MVIAKKIYGIFQYYNHILTTYHQIRPKPIRNNRNGVKNNNDDKCKEIAEKCKKAIMIHIFL
jgi:hypothetical protein